MLLQRIRQEYPTLTKSQKRLADYVAGSYREVAFMTASRLAKCLCVNEATVIRFAQRLGYTGYPELIREVRTIVRGELGAESGAQAGPESRAVAALLRARVEELERMISHVSLETLVSLADLLSDARHVHIVGQGMMAPLASLLDTALRLLGVSVIATSDEAWALSVTLTELGPDDVLLVVSAAEQGAVLANAIRLAREQGATTVAITCSPVSPSARASDLALTCAIPSTDALSEITPLALMIDVVIALLARRKQSDVAARRKELEGLASVLEGKED